MERIISEQLSWEPLRINSLKPSPPLASSGSMELSAPLTQEVFSKAGSVYVAAIVLALIVTVFLRETGSARGEAK